MTYGPRRGSGVAVTLSCFGAPGVGMPEAAQPTASLTAHQEAIAPPAGLVARSAIPDK